MEDINVQLLYGGASKAFYLMNETEKSQVAKEIRQRAKEKAFSRGLPIFYGKNNKVIAEFADGSQFLVENQELTTPYSE